MIYLIFISYRFSLCGQIVIDKLPEGLRQVPPQRRVIYFPEGKNSDAVSIATDKDGKFCTHAASGKYLIKVQPMYKFIKFIKLKCI